MDIREALAELDPLTDSDWTKDGAPRLERLGEIMGGAQPTRQDVLEVAPAFSKTSPVLPAPETAPEPEPEPAQAPEPEPGAVEAAERRIAELDREFSRLTQNLKQARYDLKMEQLKAQQADPLADETKARQAYIESQNKLRAEKAAAAGEVIRRIGADPRSALDKSFQPRRAFGTARPRYDGGGS